MLWVGTTQLSGSNKLSQTSHCTLIFSARDPLPLLCTANRKSEAAKNRQDQLQPTHVNAKMYSTWKVDDAIPNGLSWLTNRHLLGAAPFQTCILLFYHDNSVIMSYSPEPSYMLFFPPSSRPDALGGGAGEEAFPFFPLWTSRSLSTEAFSTLAGHLGDSGEYSIKQCTWWRHHPLDLKNDIKVKPSHLAHPSGQINIFHQARFHCFPYSLERPPRAAMAKGGHQCLNAT